MASDDYPHPCPERALLAITVLIIKTRGLDDYMVRAQKSIAVFRRLMGKVRPVVNILGRMDGWMLECEEFIQHDQLSQEQ
jgi:hypothetical protein